MSTKRPSYRPCSSSAPPPDPNAPDPYAAARAALQELFERTKARLAIFERMEIDLTVDPDAPVGKVRRRSR